MPKALSVLFLLAVLFFYARPLSAVLVIKMGAITPENSPWGDAINKMADEWRKISNGEIELKIYHNGIAGGESDMIRKMRIGQLQAAVLTSFGLKEIVPDILSLSMPSLISTDSDLDYVMARLKPTLEKKFEQKKFKVVAWSRAGWVRFFSKKPVVFPADLKTQKVSANPDEQALMQAFKEMGYQQVPVAIPDVLSSLNSGLIDALYASPIAVGGFQWFGLAKYMMTMKISQFIGGIIIADATWKKIPPRMQTQLLAATRKIEKELDANVRKMEEESIKTMQSYGLVIVPTTPEAEAAWQVEFHTAIQKLLGKSFSREMYDEIQKYLKENKKK